MPTKPTLDRRHRVDMRERIEFLGFTPDVTRGPACRAPPSSTSPSTRRSRICQHGRQRADDPVLEENVRLRTDRADDTLQFFEAR